MPVNEHSLKSGKALTHNPGLPPIMRMKKSKQQLVDEKVERLFESYRLIDAAAFSQREAHGIGGMPPMTAESMIEEQQQELRNKYW